MALLHAASKNLHLALPVCLQLPAHCMARNSGSQDLSAWQVAPTPIQKGCVSAHTPTCTVSRSPAPPICQPLQTAVCAPCPARPPAWPPAAQGRHAAAAAETPAGCRATPLLGQSRCPWEQAPSSSGVDRGWLMSWPTLPHRMQESYLGKLTVANMRHVATVHVRAQPEPRLFMTTCLLHTAATRHLSPTCTARPPAPGTRPACCRAHGPAQPGASPPGHAQGPGSTASAHTARGGRHIVF